MVASGFIHIYKINKVLFLCHIYQIHSDQHVFMWHPVGTFSILTFENKTFFKKLEYHFLAESTKIENVTFTKLPRQKPVLRQIERRYINGPLTKKRDLPVTTFRSSCPEVFLEIFQIHRKTPAPESLLCRPATLFKKIFSCEAALPLQQEQWVYNTRKVEKIFREIWEYEYSVERVCWEIWTLR